MSQLILFLKKTVDASSSNKRVKDCIHVYLYFNSFHTQNHICYIVSIKMLISVNFMVLGLFCLFLLFHFAHQSWMTVWLMIFVCFCLIKHEKLKLTRTKRKVSLCFTVSNKRKEKLDLDIVYGPSQSPDLSPSELHFTCWR